MYIYSKISKNDKLWGSSYGLGLKRGLAGVAARVRPEGEESSRTEKPDAIRGNEHRKSGGKKQEKEKKNKKLRGCLRMSKKSSKFAAENELSCPCGKEILDL